MGPGELQFQSTLVFTPAPGQPDQSSSVGLSNIVGQTISGSSEFYYQLTSATPQVVSFGGLAQATAARITCDAGSINIEITTASGTNQIVPIDAGGKFEWACQSLPITAITIVGQANQTINVSGWLGTI